MPPRPPLTLVRLAFILCAAGLLAYLSLRASSSLRTVPWMPGHLGRWADTNGILRNTVAFLALGLLAFGLLGRGRRIVAALAAFAVAIEVPQIWIPTRIFDWRDIAASLAGLALAWAALRLAAVRHRGASPSTKI